MIDGYLSQILFSPDPRVMLHWSLQGKPHSAHRPLRRFRDRIHHRPKGIQCHWCNSGGRRLVWNLSSSFWRIILLVSSQHSTTCLLHTIYHQQPSFITDSFVPYSLGTTVSCSNMRAAEPFNCKDTALLYYCPDFNWFFKKTNFIKCFELVCIACKLYLLGFRTYSSISCYGRIPGLIWSHTLSEFHHL